MQKRWTLVPVLMMLLVICGISACTKTTEVGLKPHLQLKAEPGFLYSDTTIARNTACDIVAEASRSEDASLLSSFEVVRTYNDSRDTSVYYEELKGDRQQSFSYRHHFDTRKVVGKERYTFTVKNIYGVVNQQILVVTVK